MWKSRIAALLVVIAALVAADLVIRSSAPAQAARGQIVTAPERYVSVSTGDGVIVRMSEFGKVEYYDWSGGMSGRGFAFQQWTGLP